PLVFRPVRVFEPKVFSNRGLKTIAFKCVTNPNGDMGGLEIVVAELGSKQGDQARDSNLSAMHFRYECRMADLHRELEQTRAAFEELKSIVRARQHAEQELAALHRERDIARAEAAERDPNAALN